MFRSRSRLRRPATLALAASLLLAVGTAGLLPAPRAAAAPRKVTRLEPDALDILRSPKKFLSSTRRHVIVRPDRLELLRGPAMVASIPFPGRRGASLVDVAAALARTAQAGWIEETAPGTFLLRVALVQAPGSALEVAAPAVRQVRLLDDPEVYISAMGATARFTGVTVTSWDPQRRRPARNSGSRPFVEYADGSDLWIVRSTFAHLGSDRASAYGVNWRRSTGGATDSVFHHNFFGAYTYQAQGLVFRGNVFRDNQLYGLDPHTGSRRLVVERNQAYRNGAHGIVFSEDVTDGVVRGNRSFANGDNGIVLDERSDRNTVSDNLVEGNEGDGIVLLGSSDNLVRGNVVRRNRVGIRVNLRSGDNRVQRNQLAGNRIGVELYGGAYAVRLLGNQVGGSVEKGLVLEAPGGDQSRRPGHRVADRRRDPGPGPPPRDHRGRGRPGDRRHRPGHRRRRRRHRARRHRRGRGPAGRPRPGPDLLDRVAEPPGRVAAPGGAGQPAHLAARPGPLAGPGRRRLPGGGDRPPAAAPEPQPHRTQPEGGALGCREVVSAAGWPAPGSRSSA